MYQQKFENFNNTNNYTRFTNWKKWKWKATCITTVVNDAIINKQVYLNVTDNITANKNCFVLNNYITLVH